MERNVGNENEHGPLDAGGSEEPSKIDALAMDMQVEGQLDMDAIQGLDAGLEAALSKSWDNLELFGEKQVLSGKMPRPIVDIVKKEAGDGVEKNNNGKGPEEADGSPQKDDSRSSLNDLQSIDSKKDTSTIERKDGSEGIAFLGEATVSASDEAVEGIVEASTSKKNKKTAAAKKTAKKKKATANTASNWNNSDIEEEVEMSQAEMLNSEEWDPDPRWFFVQVKPGCEQSCAISIRNMTQSLELDIHEVLVPTTKIMRLTKSGKSVKKEERIFPSYILVHMAMNRETYSEIQRVPNVQCFMGDPNRDKAKNQPFRPPLPVSDIDMRAVFERVKEADSLKPEVKTAIRPGDMVEVISGTFVGKRGRVSAVKPDLNVVVANLIIFAREASTELQMHQVRVMKEEDIAEFHMDTAWDDDTPKSSAKRNVQASAGAGIASAADDLAMLLSEHSDQKIDPDDELARLLETDDGFPFLGTEGASKSEGGTTKTKQKKESDSAEDLAKLFEEEDGDLSSIFDDLEDLPEGSSSPS